MQLRDYPPAADGRAKATWQALERRLDCRLERPDGAGVAWDARPPKATALPSPGLAAAWSLGCNGGMLDEGLLIKINQWAFAATVLLAVMMTRFATSSWTVSLIVGAMLLSRGRLLADLGRLGVDGFTMLTTTAWLSASAHFLRTGARITAAIAAASVGVGALVDPSLVGLAVAVPALLALGFLWRRRLAKPVIQRLRGTRRRQMALQDAATPSGSTIWPHGGEVVFPRVTSALRGLFGQYPALPAAGPRAYERGSLFRTIDVPFLLWAYTRRRWLRLAAGWTLVAVIGLGAALGAAAWLSGTGWVDGAAASPAGGLFDVWRTRWSVMQLDRFDLHLATSLAIVVVCALQSPAAGLPGFLELSWLTLVGLCGVLLAAALGDRFDAALAYDALPTVRAVISWFEPAVLSLGVAGLYNLMRVLDTRFSSPA